jgi:hypothetical protein
MKFFFRALAAPDRLGQHGHVKVEGKQARRFWTGGGKWAENAGGGEPKPGESGKAGREGREKTEGSREGKAGRAEVPES